METDEQKQIVRLFVSTSEIGRTMVIPPGVPKERVEALRAGFVKMTKDPALLAEAKKMNLDLDPLSGEQLQALVASTFELKADVVEHARKIFPASK
jgi:tripartite-type tricarboxylate transporter receptor subunit TctC